MDPSALTIAQTETLVNQELGMPEIPKYLIAEMLALAVAIWKYNKMEPRQLRLLAPFLFFIVVVEWIGHLNGKVYKMSIGPLFNYSLPLEYSFYSIMVISFLRNRYLKIIGFTMVIATGILVIINNLLSREEGFHAVYIKVGVVCVLLCCFFFFIDTLRDEQILNPIQMPGFWIACGLFLFNIGELLFAFGFSRLSDKPQAWSHVFKMLNNNLNLLLYGCIIVAIMIASWKK